MKKFLCIGMVFIFLSSISLNGCLEEECTSDSSDTWTIFLYLCATDLESEGGAASDNLDELMDVSYNEQVNFIVQTGGTSKWYNDDIDPDYIQRFLIRNGEMELLDEKELESMGSSDTFSNFITWGIEKYPADKNAIIFWNHGGGSISGVAFDELYDNDSLTLDEISQAMKNISLKIDKKFEFIGFDTCLMATLENADILAPYADYLVSSEETEPGGGWDYKTWVQYLANHTGIDGREIGEKICDSYFEKCKDYEEESMATLSVVDLSKIPALVEAFNGMAGELYSGISDNSKFAEIARGAGRCENYGGNSSDEGYTNLIDLGDLTVNIENEVTSSEDVFNALDEAVVYMKNGDQRQYANGISVYYPLKADKEELDFYNNIAPSENYNKFIQSIVNGIIEFENSNEDLVKIASEPHVNEKGYYEMTIDKATLDYVNSINFTLYQDIGDNEYIYLGMDNEIDADLESGIVCDEFRGVWQTMGDTLLSIDLVEETDEYNVYSAPILLNGEETNLRFAWVWDDEDDKDGDGVYGKYKILGLWDGIDETTGMSTRNLKKLKKGDKIAPIYYVYNSKTGEEYEMEGEEFTYKKGMNIEEQFLEDGDYLFCFDIIDIYEQDINTDFAEINIDGEYMEFK